MKQELDTSMRDLTVCRVTHIDKGTRKALDDPAPVTYAGKHLAVEVWDTVAGIYRVMGTPAGVERNAQELAALALAADAGPVPAMGPEAARQIVDLYLELRKYGSALVRYRTPLVEQAYSLVASSVHPHTAWEGELLRDDQHAVMCQCPYSTLDRRYVADCYGIPVASYDDPEAARKGHERHIRSCPKGAMPWAVVIEWRTVLGSVAAYGGQQASSLESLSHYITDTAEDTTHD